MFLTGWGAVSALGSGASAIASGLASGRDGFIPIGRFDTSPFRTHLGALVAWEPPGALSLFEELALAAAGEALAARRAVDCRIEPSRLGLVLGTSLGDHADGIHRYAERLGERIGARGPRVTVSTACASSTNAIGLARDLLGVGAADAVLAGGVDTLTVDAFAGFDALGLLSTERCAPFSHPPGTTLGEGAAFALLEPIPAPGATSSRFTLQGYGLSADAYHATSPEPTGAGLARAVRAALRQARLDPRAIDYVNAHGTGTEANDAAEWRAMRAVFGAAGADALAVSASKSFLGHAQGAAGILELVATLECVAQGLVPPTRSFRGPRPQGPRDPLAGERPHERAVRHFLSSSVAFGGANAVVALGVDVPAAVPAPARPLYVIGAGEVVVARPNARRSADEPGDAAVRDGAALEALLRELVPTADIRGCDRPGALLTAAVARALVSAGASVRGDLRDRTGLFVGLTQVSREAGREYRESVAERGLGRPSVGAFARLVLNASAGTCTRLLSLRGPTTTLTSGRGSGLLAVIAAALYLRERDDVDLLVAGGLDEGDPSAGTSGRAAVVVVASEAFPVPSSPSARRVRLAGVGVAGPGEPRQARAQALAAAGLAEGDVVLVAALAGARDVPGCSGALELARAQRLVAAGALECALVQVESESCATAAVLVAEASAAAEGT